MLGLNAQVYIDVGSDTISHDGMHDICVMIQCVSGYITIHSCKETICTTFVTFHSCKCILKTFESIDDDYKCIHSKLYPLLVFCNFFELVACMTVYFSGQNTALYGSIHQLIIKIGRRKKQAVKKCVFLRSHVHLKIFIPKLATRKERALNICFL